MFFIQSKQFTLYIICNKSCVIGSVQLFKGRVLCTVWIVIPKKSRDYKVHWCLTERLCVHHHAEYSIVTAGVPFESGKVDFGNNTFFINLQHY